MSIVRQTTRPGENDTLPSPRTTGLDEQGTRSRYGWSASRSQISPKEKEALAEYFAKHDFLVPPGADPEANRKTDASIIVNPGTTPHAVVKSCLSWMSKEWNERGPFNVIWYTPGALTATELRNFKTKNHAQRSCSGAFLLPGRIDSDIESVLGEDPVQFAREQLKKRRFTYSFLSVHGLEMASGQTYFYFSDEIPLQQACAELYATQKCLFVDPGKLRTIEGSPGYTISDLLITSQAVAIYVNTSDRDRFIKEQFEKLFHWVLKPCPEDIDSEDRKMLRLCIVAPNGEVREDIPKLGVLKSVDREGGAPIDSARHAE